MSFRLDQLPKSANNATEGPATLEITKAEMAISDASGKEQMVVHFAIEGGGNLREYYQISPSPFMMFKLRRLIEATDIRLGNAEVSLKDIAKMLPRETKIGALLKKNDRGYSEIDYSDAKGGMGLYPHEELFGKDMKKAIEELEAAKDLNINSTQDFKTEERPATADLKAIEDTVIEDEDF